MDSTLHAHVVARDGRMAGHLDALHLAPGWRLAQPAADTPEDRPTMELSARNVLKEKVVEVARGATTARVRIEIGGGNVVTASITNEAIDELRLATGDTAYAVIKASAVMVGKD